jgi:hypothetical protein
VEQLREAREPPPRPTDLSHVFRGLVLAHLPGQLGLPQTHCQVGLVGTPEIQTDMRVSNHA